MGSVESKIALTARFQRLWTVPDIPKDDTTWSALLAPSSGSAHEFFSLVAGADVRRVRDMHPENFEMLLHVVTDRLGQLCRSAAVGTSVEPQIRQCVRVVTRIFPFVYERPTTPGREFWAPRFVWRGSGSVGKRLVDILSDLLLMRGFAVSMDTGDTGVWAVGIGRKTPPSQVPSNMIENRIEAVRALLSVLSEPLYVPTGQGLDYWTTTSTDRANLLWSLINYALAYTPKLWNKPFDQGGLLPEPEAHLAALSIELAVLAIIHIPPLPGKNLFRRNMAKLGSGDDQEQDLWFVVGRLAERIVEGDTSLPFLALLWEAVQANRKLRDVVTKAVAPILNEKLLDLALSSSGETSRVASYILLTLTADAEYATQSGAAILRKFFGPESPGSIRPLPEPALADVLWNVSPYLDPGIREAQQLAITINRSQDTDNGISEALVACARVILDSHPDTLHLARELAAANVDIPKGAPQWQPLTFMWDADRLRWYSGVLWGCVYRTEQQNRFGVGVWRSTRVELFRVESSQHPGPSLRRPQGAVDASADVAARVFDVATGAAAGVISRLWTSSTSGSSN